MIAQVVNGLAILIGGFVGNALRGGISERFRSILMQAMALAVMLIGLRGAVQTGDVLIVVISWLSARYWVKSSTLKNGWKIWAISSATASRGRAAALLKALFPLRSSSASEPWPSSALWMRVCAVITARS